MQLQNINSNIRIFVSIFIAFFISQLIMKLTLTTPTEILTQLLRINIPIKTNLLPTYTPISTNNQSEIIFSTIAPSIPPTKIISISITTRPTTTSVINIPPQTPSSLPTVKSSPTTRPSPTPTKKPTATPTPAGACPAMNNGLPNSTMHYPTGSTAIPSTTKEICAYSAGQYQSLPYRNPNCPVTQAGINKAYERMKTYYPTSWQSTKLLKDWKTVQQYAVKYNFNPLFVIALWIEESAAGGNSAAQQLGCLYRLNKDDTFTFLPASSTICEQMECLFGRRSVVPTNYAIWACQYRWGAAKWQNNHCLEVTRFVRGIEFWYKYIGENLPSSCQIKYYSPADNRC